MTHTHTFKYNDFRSKVSLYVQALVKKSVIRIIQNDQFEIIYSSALTIKFLKVLIHIPAHHIEIIRNMFSSNYKLKSCIKFTLTVDRLRVPK